MPVGVRQRFKEDGSNTKPTRYYSRRQEDSIAKAVGGKRIPNSGATAWAKGDVHSEQWLLEAKTKTKASDSITLQKEWFEKNRQEAVFMGKPYTALVFSFGPGEENHYVIDEDLFIQLSEYLKNVR